MGTGIVEDPPNPDTPEVFQREILAPALLVHPDGPVGVKELPTKHGAAFTFATTTTPAKALGGPDEKRKRVLLCSDEAFLVSFKPTGTGARMPANTVIDLTFIGPIYLAAAADTTDVAVICEYWAD